MRDDLARDSASFHHMLNEFERHVAEIPAKIDACASEAEAIAIIKQWLCDDLDYDLIVAAWERKAKIDERAAEWAGAIAPFWPAKVIKD